MKLLKKLLKKLRFIRRCVRFYYKLKKGIKFITIDIKNIEPVYSKVCPSNQTMADILKGTWESDFPDEYEVKAGNIRHFDSAVDWRVQWVNAVLPEGIKGLSVLELGPFEAYNTWQLEKFGAKSIKSIEANNLNFLKCLIVKEIAGIKARFLYGGFIPYFEKCSEKFDIVWASGVLYHHIEPLKLLESISRFTDKVFVYTHYYDEDVIQANKFLSDYFIKENNVTTENNCYQAELHYKSYNENKDCTFCGGIEDFSFWMEKKDILGFLHHLGFNKIKIKLNQLDNPNGPVLCFLAEREL